MKAMVYLTSKAYLTSSYKGCDLLKDQNLLRKMELHLALAKECM